MLFCVSLSIVALALVGLAVLIRAAVAAPYAVEDERGFHLVDQSKEQKAPTMPEAPANAPDLAFFHR